jgi:hypothetical protein
MSQRGGSLWNRTHLGLAHALQCRIAGGFMLYTIAVVLLVLWLLGMVTAYTVGGLLHILLVIAVVLVLIQVIQGRRVV